MPPSASLPRRSAGPHKKARNLHPLSRNSGLSGKQTLTLLQRAIANWGPVAKLEKEFQRLGHLPMPQWRFDPDVTTRHRQFCCYTQVFGRTFGGGLFFYTTEKAKNVTAQEILDFIKVSRDAVSGLMIAVLTSA